MSSQAPWDTVAGLQTPLGVALPHWVSTAWAISLDAGGLFDGGALRTLKASRT